MHQAVRGLGVAPHSVLSELALDRVGVDSVPLQADGCAVQDPDLNVSGRSPGICNVLGEWVKQAGLALGSSIPRHVLCWPAPSHWMLGTSVGEGCISCQTTLTEMEEA